MNKSRQSEGKSVITIKSTATEVCNYLKTIKLNQWEFKDVADNFKEECIDGKLFLNLEKCDSNQLGIFKLSKINSLLDHLKVLRKLKINKGYDSAIPTTNVDDRSESNSPSIGTQMIDEIIVSSVNTFPDNPLELSKTNYRRFSCPEFYFSHVQSKPSTHVDNEGSVMSTDAPAFYPSD
eukprot:235198_1